MKIVGVIAGSFLLLPEFARAAGFHEGPPGLLWGVPFLGMLLSIAILPAVLPHFWHVHFGKVATFWGAALLLPLLVATGLNNAGQIVVHALLVEYLPFILLLFALYTVSGGILVSGHLHGSPRLNTGILALGTLLASLMGTTGAAMLLIRPLLRANENRRHRAHIVVFFIFLVANVGGGLTPMGDPPLFLGFLEGIDFFWTVRAMSPAVLVAAFYLLGLFFLVDAWFYRREGKGDEPPVKDDPLRLHGGWNFLLIVAVVGAVLLSGMWKSGVEFNVWGTQVALQNAVRDVLLLLIGLVSLWLTPAMVRSGNEFNWFPMQEVAKLFVTIFITITPVIAMLKAGPNGPLAGLVSLVSGPDGAPIHSMYFWMTGVLSSFLDNAPTYLVFFNLSSGDPVQLMGPLSRTLLAISMGAVFMGANTYIGNAPNFMVKAMAEHRNVEMPGFFGFMLWSSVVLLPLFGLMTLLFF
ncbi:MAG: sodium:proton antiporter [Formivibrio sp.]|nr:sodium:proton antiporter [Formivibrio sp.]